MTRKWIYSKMMVLLFTVSVILFVAGGCSCPKKLKALEQENAMLTDRVAELENQLVMADAAATAQQSASQSVYIVTEGDTLWNIAQKQLGKGSRYKEILALNPQLSENTPLTIGTKLTLPSK